MKKFYIYFLVILCLVCSLFVSVSASEYKDFNLNLNYRIWDDARDLTYGELSLEKENVAKYLVEIPSDSTNVGYSVYTSFGLTFNKVDGTYIATSGDTFTIYIDNIFTELYLDSNWYNWDDYSITAKIFYLYHPDGTSTRIDTDINWYYDSVQNSHDVSTVVTTSKDVVRIKYFEYINLNAWTGFFGYAEHFVLAGDNTVPLTVSVDIKSKELGALEDIEDKIDNAVNGEVDAEKSPVDDNVNDLIGEEDKLINDTQQGRDNIVTYITQAISELSAYATAFVALNAIVDGFFYLPIIGPLIVISLSMGIFALIVNLAQTVSRSDKATKPKGKGNGN